LSQRKTKKYIYEINSLEKRQLRKNNTNQKSYNYHKNKIKNKLNSRQLNKIEAVYVKLFFEKYNIKNKDELHNLRI